MEGAARGEVEGEKHLLELVVQVKVLTVAFIGLVSNVPMPMSSLPPDARCATSSAGENYRHLWQDKYGQQTLQTSLTTKARFEGIAGVETRRFFGGSFC